MSVLDGAEVDQGAGPLAVPFVFAGRLVEGTDVEYKSRDMGTGFATPKIDFDALVVPRGQPLPASGLKVAEIIDFLVEVGERMTPDKSEHLRDAVEQMTKVHPAGRRLIANSFNELHRVFDRELLEFQVEAELGGADVLDGWRRVDHPGAVMGDEGATHAAVRALPPRIVHVMAGNSSFVAALTLARGALTKGVHVLKMASNDLFTATALLRTMADVDPDHPTTRSFSAVYWRGGDESIESILFRSQWFDKIVAWGGESAIDNVVKYLGPGLELIAFDPKMSISLIGREAFQSEETLAQVADDAAFDAAVGNQDGCGCSRFQFIEASEGDADRFCEILQQRLGVDRYLGDGTAPLPPAEVRENVEVLRHMAPLYRVWGQCDGRGVVVRSDEPVDWYPDGKTINVIPVAKLEDALSFIGPATQTVGIYPEKRKMELRDAVAGAGGQRIVPLGGAGNASLGGLPHDSMYPLHRFVHWAVDEDISG